MRMRFAFLFRKEVYMRINKILADELETEKRVLKDIRRRRRSYPSRRLVISKNKRGYERFYYREPSGKRLTYIKVGDRGKLRAVAYGRYLEEYEKILKSNIALIEKILEVISDYDHESIMANLPASYRHAIDIIGKKEGPKVIQSENPKHRDQLTVKTSNGLYVRSKNEMTIYEMLQFFKLNVRYEMALELDETIREEDGTVAVWKITVYPDFTIFLPDGTVIYWEHFGLLDRDNYRDDFTEKLKLYYDNGIYPPKNLIITMDGDGKPFNNLMIRKIIEAQILPFC